VKVPVKEVTVSVMVVVTGVSVPEVPVIVIGYVPATVVEATVNVATLEVVEDVGLNATDTPVG
jgi:acyl-homoserine lactone acylase PvdQ